MLDVLRYYGAVIRALSTGKPVAITEYQWFSGTDLARIIEHLAYSEAEMDADVIAGLARRLGQMAAKVPV